VVSRPRHLLAVWNPSYADDPMDAHIRVLLHWVERRRRGEAGEEDVYVWWARIRSPNRRDDLPHLPDVLALQQQIDDGVETHLYLTDYRSLYVGLLDEITGDDVLREWPDEADHMPAYYRGQRVDVWFRLLDIRRIVADDTLAVIEELRKLRNVHYHDRPVSLYGGMTNLPLVLTRDEEVRWFRDTATLLDGRLWVEHSIPGDAPHRLADVYSPDGMLVERRAWPADVDLSGAAWLEGDAALGVRRDSLGVEQVVRVRFAGATAGERHGS